MILDSFPTGLEVLMKITDVLQKYNYIFDFRTEIHYDHMHQNFWFLKVESHALNQLLRHAAQKTMPSQSVKLCFGIFENTGDPLTVHFTLVGQYNLPAPARRVYGQRFLEALLDVRAPYAFRVGRRQFLVVVTVVHVQAEVAARVHARGTPHAVSSAVRPVGVTAGRAPAGRPRRRHRTTA